MTSLVLALLGAVLQPLVLQSDDYAETFTFVADLTDGTYVQLQLAVTNLGPGSRHGICRALVTRAGQRPWTASRRFGEDDWRWRSTAGSTPEEERLEIGPCTALVGTRTEVVARLHDGEVRLTFPTRPAPSLPPAARIVVGAGAHVTELLYAFVPVEADLALPGRPTVHATGGGYADHSRADIPARKLARRWFRFRALQGAQRALALGREAPDGAPGPLWIWREGSVPQALNRFTLDENGPARAAAWTVLASGPAATLRIDTSALVFRHAPLEDLGLFARWIAGAVAGKPVTYTYRAVLREEGRPDTPGVLEISRDESN